MNFYQILPTRKVPQTHLTYSSESELEIGQIVDINIRGSQTWAIVIAKTEESAIEFDKSKIKPISNVYNLKLEKNTLGFLKIFSQNTFNSVNLSLSSFLQPFKLITQKQWKSLPELSSEGHILPTNHPPTKKTDFLLDMSITLRIIYIIRSTLDTITNATLLIILPEKKYLNKIMEEVESNETFKNSLKNKVEIYNYCGDVNKKSKEAIWSLLTSDSLKLKIVFATRAGIFLPFKDLNSIILVDEANAMHIQDQNSIYFDTRDAVFLLSQAHNANLNFVSTLPSIRLHHFYPEIILEQFDFLK